MSVKKLGMQTVKMENPPSILSTGTIVGPKEGEGPLSKYFDIIIQEDLFGEDSWEKAESKMSNTAVKKALEKANLSPDKIDYLCSGDLLNQIISSSFAARDLKIPFFGLYGACSTMTESISIASMLIDGGFASYAIASTSSHFCSAERQFRFPLEMGNQRPPTSQWTATAAGAVILGKNGKGPYITYVTTGRIMDFGIKDANNMGAAMAPAAADTILRHFKDTGFGPKDYDLIATGDLGDIGRELTREMVQKGGYDISSNFTDCGVELFNLDTQDVHAGASGCGCSAVVFGGYFYNQLMSGKLKKMMLISTGALLSPTSSQQGESIPGIAHAVTIEMR